MRIYFYSHKQLNEYFYALYSGRGLSKNRHELLSIPTQDYVDDSGKKGFLTLVDKMNNPKFLKHYGIELILFHGFSFINMLTGYNLDYFLPEVADLPYAVMWFDNPLRYLTHLRHIKNTRYAFFVCDSELAEEMRQRGYTNTHYAPCMFDPDIQNPRPVNPTYACDLAFAGTVSTWEHVQKNRNSLNFYQIRILNDLLKNRVKGQFYDYVSGFNGFGIDCEDASFPSLALANILEQKHLLRMELFDACKDFQLTIHGQGNWESPHPNIIHKGNLHQHHELPELYASGKIQLTIELLPASVHQRIMEVCGCEGFILGEDKTDMPKCFETYEIFKDFSDLKEKITYYLENEDARLKMAETMHQEAMDKHRNDIRMKQVMDTIEKTIM